jgi:hypothetical protein
MRVRLRLALIALHRWMGVALVSLFLLWFPSGIVMMYWSFPEVTGRDRLQHAEPLNPPDVRLTPAEALRRAELVDTPLSTRIDTFDGRPVYRFRDADGETVIYADTGEPQLEVSAAMRRRIAAAWTRQPADSALESALVEVDQWTVGGSLRTLRPLWKYSWPGGDEVYVAGATGEVVQATTRSSRIAAYLGAIPHWLYFTPIRRHAPQWSRLVIWTSGIATAAAIIGIVIGIWMYSPRRRYRYAGSPTSIPYRGQKRWHMLLGLIFGIAAATWAFSGMLSMDPFPRRDDLQQGLTRRALVTALRSAPQLERFDAKTPRQALEQLGRDDVAELELTSFAGRPLYVATLTGGDTMLVPIDGATMHAFSFEEIADVVRSAIAPAAVTDIHLVNEYDAYYLDRRGEMPLPVVVARVADAATTTYYIDPATAQVVGAYSRGDWAERWLYHGLHSLNFPWLYTHRPLWDIVVLTLLAGGTALCVTSFILAWRVLGRTLRPRRNISSTATEDLIPQTD